MSLQYYQHALHLRKLIKDNIGISNSITNIGRIKLKAKDYDRLQTKRQHRQLTERQKIIEKFNKELAAGSEAYQKKASEPEEVVHLLQKTNAELKELNREKDGLMSIMAHDLKTPLEGIKGLIGRDYQNAESLRQKPVGMFAAVRTRRFID